MDNLELCKILTHLKTPLVSTGTLAAAILFFGTQMLRVPLFLVFMGWGCPSRALGWSYGLHILCAALGHERFGSVLNETLVLTVTAVG